jgi:membrane protease YdiL (CAAX protease family)
MKRKIIEIIILFSAFFLPGYVFQSSLQTAASAHFQSMMIGYIVLALPHIFILVYIIWIQQPPLLKDFGITKPDKKLLYALPVFLGTFVVVTPLLLLLQLLPQGVKDQVTTPLQWGMRNPFQIPLIAVFCLTVGYREELFFRSYLLTRFGEFHVNKHIAAVTSSLIFASAHLYENLFGFISAFLLGLFFCYIFYEWKNIHIIALAHAAYNFTLLVINF